MPERESGKAKEVTEVLVKLGCRHPCPPEFAEPNFTLNFLDTRL